MHLSEASAPPAAQQAPAPAAQPTPAPAARSEPAPAPAAEPTAAPAAPGEPMARAAARLREAGLRVTAQRIAVLTAVETLAGHSDVESIRTAARNVTGQLSVQAAYNVLRVLTDAGLLRCTQFAGHSARYEIERHDNHHHFVCRRCGTILDTGCHIGAAPCLTSDLPDAYVVDEAAVTFWGLCPQCAASAARTRSA